MCHMETPAIKLMHLSSIFPVLTVGLWFISLVQSSGLKTKRRVNRLRSVLKDSESGSGAVSPAAVEPESLIISASSESTEVDASENLVDFSSSTAIADNNHVAVSPVEVVKMSLEDRRQMIFDTLYRAYEGVVGRYANAGCIEWTRVKVLNWPSYIDMSDMSKWTEDDVNLLSFLIESDLIEFALITKWKKNPPAPLMDQRRRLIPIEIAKTDAYESDTSDLESVSENELATDRTVEIKAKTVPALKLKFCPKRSDFKSIKVESSEPADPVKRAAILSKVLEIYRRDSGKLTASEIDWNDAIVRYLQNHQLPFSTAFETEGDVLTLEAAMKHKYFGFHNLSTLTGRRFKLYERFYQHYAAAAGLSLVDPFFIKWNQVKVENFPEGVHFNYMKWSLADVEQLERDLDAELIKFTSIHTEDSTESVVKAVKRKREIKEESVDEIAVGKSTEKIAKTSEFDDNELGTLTPEISIVLENLLSLKSAFAQSHNHQRIVKEMITCFNLMQKWADKEILTISANEILDFLEIFRKSLESIGSDFTMDEKSLKKFLIAALKLRARLAGIGYVVRNGKRVLNITIDRINNPELFGFLRLTESKWANDLELLKFAIDDEENSIFH